MWFFDVGDGTATLVQTPSGRQILIDAGGSGRKLSNELGSALPFWDRRIDLLILTQPTGRQIDSLPTILPRYKFDAMMTNGISPTTQTGEAIWSTLNKRHIPLVAAQPGTRVVAGDEVSITVIQTENADPNTDDDSNPISLMLTYGDARFLIPGDLSPEAEQALLQGRYLLDATVLHIPRSGHRATSSSEFLAAIQPQIMVLSVDAGNRYGLPHQETLERLNRFEVPLYRTDQSGTIHLISNGHQLWVRTAR